MTPAPEPQRPARRRNAHHPAALPRTRRHRLRYADLLAAAHATLSAAREDEPAALEYLADELAAQHGPHLDRGPHWWNEVGR